MLILGRQSALGLAELESLFGAAFIKPAGHDAALVKLPSKAIDFKRLGGSVKLCSVISSLATNNWQNIIDYLIYSLPAWLNKSQTGKINLGISTYGFNVSPTKINACGLNLKKVLARTGRSARIVPNESSKLNAASIIHNKLLGSKGLELVLVKDGAKTIIGQTTAVQDIGSYTLRDRGRPKRDPRVGMLPPKLAQIIINLATGDQSGCTILDPFCGTGVILQEALLMGFDAWGTDIDQRMVDYSFANIDWFKTTRPEIKASMNITLADATKAQWQGLSKSSAVVASETYLGRPLTSKPNPEILAKTISECNLIIKKFLQNVHEQVNPGTRFCLAVPAWQIEPGTFRHLPLIDQISDLGYNRISSELAKRNRLIYYRENQVVARELLVITRNN